MSDYNRNRMLFDIVTRGILSGLYLATQAGYHCSDTPFAPNTFINNDPSTSGYRYTHSVIPKGIHYVQLTSLISLHRYLLVLH